MAEIGEAELDYCDDHGIPLNRLFDAEGLKPAAYKDIMGAEDMWAAFGVKPCRKNGHVLRNRHGTCLMCDPQTVAHMLRSKLPGFLYVAEGGSRQFMKLGFSNADPFNRISIANSEGWGGHQDWRLVARGWSAKAGKLESELHGHFRERQVRLPWIRNGRATATTESFIADIPEACSKLVWLCDAYPEFF